MERTMNRLVAILVASAISTTALAQAVDTKSGPKLPVNPNTTNSPGTDDNGIGAFSAPGSTSTGAVRDSTTTGDNGAYATTGQKSPDTKELDDPEPKK